MDYLTSCEKECGSVLPQLRGYFLFKGGNANK